MKMIKTMTARQVAELIRDTKPETFARMTEKHCRTMKLIPDDVRGEVFAEVRKLRREIFMVSTTPEERDAARQRSIEAQKEHEEMMAVEAKRRQRLEMAEELTDEIHAILTGAGATLVETSLSGSRYYSLRKSTIRVSDHQPNEATGQWLERTCGQWIDLGGRSPVHHARQIIEETGSVAE